jgi:glycosyltransferase involved in cell wall biosynthesis
MATPAGRPRVTVIMPCRNERAHIRQSLASVLASDLPPADMEVLVVDGASTDGTADLVREIARSEPRVRLLENPARIVPTALNRAIREAAGDVIVRLDAHNEYPPEYIPRLVGWLERTGADNVGGAWVTRPGAPTPVAQGIARALSHPFGIGNAKYRLGVGDPVRVDTVPFGCYRRDVFDRIGLFDEELVRNQDDEFNLRLIRAGGTVLLVPDVVSYYHARASFRQLARMYYQYGYYKPLVIRKVGAVMTARQLAPAALILGLLVLVAGSIAWTALRPLLGVAVSLYLVAAAVAAAHAAKGMGWRTAASSFLAFPILHFGYGIGFLWGAARLAVGRHRPSTNLGAVPISR